MLDYYKTDGKARLYADVFEVDGGGKSYSKVHRNVEIRSNKTRKHVLEDIKDLIGYSGNVILYKYFFVERKVSERMTGIGVESIDSTWENILNNKEKYNEIVSVFDNGRYKKYDN
jgi:hypothetical protein